MVLILWLDISKATKCTFLKILWMNIAVHNGSVIWIAPFSSFEIYALIWNNWIWDLRNSKQQKFIFYVACSPWAGWEFCFLSSEFWAPGGESSHCLENCWLRCPRERGQHIMYWPFELPPRLTTLLKFHWTRQIAWPTPITRGQNHWILPGSQEETEIFCANYNYHTGSMSSWTSFSLI